jgi:hypothetical protein
MEDRRTAEGVEHLQAAARELLGAARAFLDVVEDVVEDSDRLNGAAATLTDLLKGGLGGKRPPVWDDADWEPDPSAARKRDDGRSTAWFDEPFEVDDPAAETVAGKAPAKKAPAKKAAARKAPAKKAAAGKAPAKKAAAGKAPAKKPSQGRAPAGGSPVPSRRSTSRVRRIAVD